MTGTLWKRSTGAPPLILAHRGARRSAPENTLEAFELAVRQGADGVELDVRLTADDRVVVLHDSTLERVTRGRDSRAVERMSFAELRAVDVRGSRVPELSSVLSWAANNQTLLNIELKHDVPDQSALIGRVLEMLEAVPDLTPRLLLSCLDARMVWALSRRAPSLPVGWILERGPLDDRRVHGWRRIGAAAVHPKGWLCTEAAMSAWARGGAWVNVWCVNAPSEALAFAANGVSALFTDEPGRLRAAFS
jgi:glycerophosphoryl diester phosphodiesterase